MDELFHSFPDVVSLRLRKVKTRQLYDDTSQEHLLVLELS